MRVLTLQETTSSRRGLTGEESGWISTAEEKRHQKLAELIAEETWPREQAYDSVFFVSFPDFPHAQNPRYRKVNN